MQKHANTKRDVINLAIIKISQIAATDRGLDRRVNNRARYSNIRKGLNKMNLNELNSLVAELLMPMTK